MQSSPMRLAEAGGGSQCTRPAGHITEAEAAALAWGDTSACLPPLDDACNACPECWLRTERAKAMRTCCRTGSHISPEDAADMAEGEAFPMSRVRELHERCERCGDCSALVDAAVRVIVRRTS